MNNTIFLFLGTSSKSKVYPLPFLTSLWGPNMHIAQFTLYSSYIVKTLDWTRPASIPLKISNVAYNNNICMVSRSISCKMAYLLRYREIPYKCISSSPAKCKRYVGSWCDLLDVTQDSVGNRMGNWEILPITISVIRDDSIRVSI